MAGRRAKVGEIIMRVFVTGANGFIGTCVTRNLLAHGHQVVGLARSERSAAALRAMGAVPHWGSLRDLDSLRRGVAQADGVIHLAFTFSPMDLPPGRVLGALFGGWPAGIPGRMMGAIAALDRAALETFGAALQGSCRPLVAAFATMGVAGPPGERAGRLATEEDAPNARSPGYGRALNEAALEGWAARGVRASIIRLAPSVHGDSDKGLVPQLIRASRKWGEAIYVDDGANRWCGVHREDAATLFRLALEQGAPGRVYHGVGDDGVTFRQIAEVIGRRLELPVRSKPLAEARRKMGWLGPFIAVDNPASSERTRQELGWQPLGPILINDIDRAAYFAS